MGTSRLRGGTAQNRILAAHRANPTATNKQIAQVTGHHVSTVARHRPRQQASASVAPAAATATLAGATPPAASTPGVEKGKEWWPPGYTPGFTDYYQDILPEDASVSYLDAMLDSHDHDVLAAVAIHPNTNGNMLNYIASMSPVRAVQAAMLTNPRLPACALAEIYDDMPGPPFTPVEQQARAICEAHPNWAGPAANEEDTCGWCGDRLDLDGYDGYCGNCADRFLGADDG